MPLPDNPYSATSADSGAPLLNRDAAFWGMVGTQYLGAFNDNLFKQLVLLLALRVTENDLQPLAMAVFSIPFLLFSGVAGFLSDRHSKRRVIVLSKFAEILVMSAGLGVFLLFDTIGFAGLMVVLFLMGTQSAFFGPGKYGILPEMLREEDLPRANGIILMTTFLAIIFGTAAAGFLSDWALRDAAVGPAGAGQLWAASSVCVMIALLGTATSILIRPVPGAQPSLRFSPATLAVTAEVGATLRRDRPLLLALLASCVFWLLAGVTQQAVNSFGKDQLQASDSQTSLLAAAIGVGIAAGAVIAGKLSRGSANFRVMRVGAWGMLASLLLMALPGPIHGHRWGFGGSLLVLVLLGGAAGLFAIPLQVFIQARPPAGQKGRMIAAMNQANFLAIFLSAGVYLLFDRIALAQGWNRASLFGLSALLVLPVVLFYRPHPAEQEN